MNKHLLILQPTKAGLRKRIWRMEKKGEGRKKKGKSEQKESQALKQKF